MLNLQTMSSVLNQRYNITNYADAKRLNLDQPQVRLLRVLPPDSIGILNCEIKVERLPAKYTALSYCWGSPEPSEIINIHIREDVYFLKVRKNLYDYLFLVEAEARNGIEVPWLWIDAICIDQSNTEERNQQVQQMGRVYREAQEVIVWLGRDFELSFLLCNVRDLGAETVDSRDAQLKTLLVEQQMLTVFERLHQLPYWSRLWITQEILLPKLCALKVTCANETMSWTCFDECARILGSCIHMHKLEVKGPYSHPYELRRWAMHSMFDLRREAIYAQTIFDVQGLLRRALVSDCTDRRDMIYGLLSLLDDGDSFNVDYSLDTLELFFKAWEHFKIYEVKKGTLMLLRILGIIDIQSLVSTNIRNESINAGKVDVKNVVLQARHLPTLAEIQARFVKSGRRQTSAVTSSLSCGWCSAELTYRLTAETDTSNGALWCTDLGFTKKFHVVFVPNSAHPSSWKAKEVYAQRDPYHIQLSDCDELDTEISITAESTLRYNIYGYAVVSIDKLTLLRMALESVSAEGSPTERERKSRRLKISGSLTLSSLTSLMERIKQG